MHLALVHNDIDILIQSIDFFYFDETDENSSLMTYSIIISAAGTTTKNEQ